MAAFVDRATHLSQARARHRIDDAWLIIRRPAIDPRRLEWAEANGITPLPLEDVPDVSKK